MNYENTYTVDASPNFQSTLHITLKLLLCYFTEYNNTESNYFFMRQNKYCTSICDIHHIIITRIRRRCQKYRTLLFIQCHNQLNITKNFVSLKFYTISFGNLSNISFFFIICMFYMLALFSK